MKILNVSNESIKVLNLLSKFGSLTNYQICNLLKLKQPTVNLKLRKLINKKLIKFQKNKWSKLLLYTITKKGLNLIEKSIYVANSFYWQNIEHNDAIINTVCKLNLEIDDYLTDREIRSNLKNKREHVSDLIIKKEINWKGLKINQKTPIEVELTFKSPKSRYNEIFDFYNLKIYEKEYEFVFYLCGDRTYKKLLKLNSQNPINQNIIFLNLNEFIDI